MRAVYVARIVAVLTISAGDGLTHRLTSINDLLVTIVELGLEVQETIYLMNLRGLLQSAKG
jgi:hypothetical protein